MLGTAGGAEGAVWAVMAVREGSGRPRPSSRCAGSPVWAHVHADVFRAVRDGP
jgi:hypothetical protein